MDTRRSLYDQSPQAFWAASLASTVWVLNVGLDLFQNSVNPLAGLVVPVSLFWIAWVIIWYYLRDQRNPLCFVANLCLLIGMLGFIMWGLGHRIADADFLARYAFLPIIGPCMGVLGVGLAFLGMETNVRLHQTSPIERRRDSTIL
ncbi:MAG: hypothetical protein GEEBNDBF_02680 [bacterium]|nr:hypothetical protein [bacterium]